MNHPPSTLAPLVATMALLATVSPLSSQTPIDAVAFVGINVVNVRSGSIEPDRTVYIEGGRIRSITDTKDLAPAGAATIDGSGRYLIPGLMDMHVHLRHPMAPALLMPQFIAHGVTGVRDMNSGCDGPAREGNVCLPQMRAWAAEIKAGTLLGPRLLALSSWSVNPPWDFEVTEEIARNVVRQLHEEGVDIIKMYYRLSHDAFVWVMDEANRLGVPVGGHIPLRVTAAQASAAGLRSLEHARDFLFDCFPGTTEFRATARSQNPPLDVITSMVDEHNPAQCDETFRTFVENETWYVPTHVTRRMDAFAHDSIFRTDPRARYLPAVVWESWQQDADRMVALAPTPEGRRVMLGFYETGLDLTRRAHEAGVPIVLGTDAGDTYVFPGSGAHDELGEFVKAGLTPAQALAAATWNPAVFLDRTEDFGSVEVGKVADLVVLRANPLEHIDAVREIDAVVFGGRVLDRTRLDAMLRDVEAGVKTFKP